MKYSSADSINTVDENGVKLSADSNPPKKLNYIDDYENKPQKSMKINVMRDLKSAQKLKSAFANRRHSQLISTESFGRSKVELNPNKNNGTHTLTTSNKYDHIDPYLNVKRSQTYASATLPKNISKLRQNYQFSSNFADLGYLNNHHKENLSSTNSQTSSGDNYEGILGSSYKPKGYSFLFL